MKAERTASPIKAMEYSSERERGKEKIRNRDLQSNRSSKDLSVSLKMVIRDWGWWWGRRQAEALKSHRASVRNSERQLVGDFGKVKEKEQSLYNTSNLPTKVTVFPFSLFVLKKLSNKKIRLI